MQRPNTISVFREDCIEMGGEVLWEGTFKSWTEEPQNEIILNCWGFIVYAQTKLNFVQPCWVAFEHKYTQCVFNYAQRARKYYIKGCGPVTHTVLNLYPSDLFYFLVSMNNSMEINKVFTEVPNYKLFHFLNHIEYQDYKDDEQLTMEVILGKMRKANMKNFVPKVKFVPETIYYEI